VNSGEGPAEPVLDSAETQQVKQEAAKIVVEKAKETNAKKQKKKLSKEQQLRERKRKRRAEMIKELKQRQVKMQQLAPANASNKSLLTSDGRARSPAASGQKSSQTEEDKKSQASRMKSCGRRSERIIARELRDAVHDGLEA
jgi:hypothetical protein